MTSYKGEYFINGVDNQPSPNIVFNIKMNDKKNREKWPEDKKVKAKEWLIEQRDRLNDFINDL